MSHGITQYLLPANRQRRRFCHSPTVAGTRFFDSGGRLMRISCSRIFRNDQCAAAGLEPGTLEHPCYEPSTLTTAPPIIHTIPRPDPTPSAVAMSGLQNQINNMHRLATLRSQSITMLGSIFLSFADNVRLLSGRRTIL